MFKPTEIHQHGYQGFPGWKASDERGASCLHRHRTLSGAQKCCDQLNRPTPGHGTPQGAYDSACGYHD